MKNAMNLLNIRKYLLLAFASILLPLAATTAFSDQLHASVDRNAISVNESLTLTLRYTGSINASPDLQSLNRDFDILTQNQSTQFRSFNGQSESFTDWVVTLMPRNEGQLTIPSFSINGTRSNPLTINVTAEAELPAGQLREVFLETKLENTESYVQEQIKISYRLYFSRTIESLENPPPTMENVLVEPLAPVKYKRNVNGTPYIIYEVSYVLYPQKSGEITIPSTLWTARISQNGQRQYGFGGGRYELKRLKTEEKTINVKTQPNTFPSSATWLPSTNVTLSENWSKDPATLTAGEPLTRTISLEAEGLNSSQLPSLAIQANDPALKFYAEQPVLNDEKTDSGIKGNRTEKFAVVVNKAGEVVIPAIRIPWWDVNSQTLKYAEIPERVLVASPGATINEPKVITATQAPFSNAAASSDTPANMGTVATTPLYWKALTVMSTLAAILFFALWINTKTMLNKLKDGNQAKHARVQRKRQLKESQAFSEISKACETHNDHAVKQALSDWLELINTNTSVVSFAKTCNDAKLSLALQQLDASLYGSSDTMSDYTNLINALTAWREKRGASKTEDDSALPPLYAN